MIQSRSSNFHTNGVLINSSKRVVIVNGQTIPFADGMTGQSLTTINDKVYIDGHEIVDGKWKKTWTARIKNWF